MSGSSSRDNPESNPQFTDQPSQLSSDDGAAVLRRASDAAAQAAVRLDKRTHLDRAQLGLRRN